MLIEQRESECCSGLSDRRVAAAEKPTQYEEEDYVF